MILKCDGINSKNSYERCVYESADDRSLFKIIYHKSTESRTQELKEYVAERKKLEKRKRV